MNAFILPYERTMRRIKRCIVFWWYMFVSVVEVETEQKRHSSLIIFITDGTESVFLKSLYIVLID